MSADDRDTAHAAVWLTPAAIRDHFEGDPEMAARLRELTDEQLYDAAVHYLFTNDAVWAAFHRWCVDIVDQALDTGPAPGSAES